MTGKLLDYFKPQPTITYEVALYYAAGISFTSAINSCSLNQYLFAAGHVGGRIRSALCSLVYRKVIPNLFKTKIFYKILSSKIINPFCTYFILQALKLSKTALGETSPGKIVNLIASDLTRFENCSFSMNFIWSAPLATLIIGYVVYNESGFSRLFGMIAVFVAVPIQGNINY